MGARLPLRLRTETPPRLRHDGRMPCGIRLAPAGSLRPLRRTCATTAAPRRFRKSRSLSRREARHAVGASDVLVLTPDASATDENTLCNLCDPNSESFRGVRAIAELVATRVAPPARVSAGPAWPGRWGSRSRAGHPVAPDSGEVGGASATSTLTPAQQRVATEFLLLDQERPLADLSWAPELAIGSTRPWRITGRKSVGSGSGLAKRPSQASLVVRLTMRPAAATSHRCPL